MKEIDVLGFQGDVGFRRVGGLPRDAKPVERKGPLVVAHSETGHHHVIEDVTVAHYEVPGDPFVCYLQLGDGDCVSVHQRTWDTHEALKLLGGHGAVWEVARQREHTPEGWRRVED